MTAVSAWGRTAARLSQIADEQNAPVSSEPTAKGTGLEESAGKEDPVELDSSPTL